MEKGRDEGPGASPTGPGPERHAPCAGEDASFRAIARRRRSVTRRAALGLGGAAALALLVGPRLAWGGVGGGAWGNEGGAAYPGSRFGFDGGWGYSSNGCVWLSVSCNAVVGRMTELFLAVEVTSYYANGGIWSPTWFTDYPDTHVDSFVRDSSGAWISSTSGFYDTTYDCAWFQGPYATHALRVGRESSDWWAWAGVRAWCDSPDSAYGIDTTAEARQLIPHHVLEDDRSWKGKIATLRPEAAPHLLLDAAGGGRANGTNAVACLDSNATNQHWLVLESAQGRTRFVPVHTGNGSLLLDVSGNDWNDGDNVHLWSGTNGKNQSFWLNPLEDGSHLIVPECSGCALDLLGGRQESGTNVGQWNCYGDWGNPNQHWVLEEPLFREREPGSMALVGGGGPVESGAELSPLDPARVCEPHNYPGTTGMSYRYAWYRGAYPNERAVLVQSGEKPGYRTAEADEGLYLTCVVTAHARYEGIPYRGEVAAPSVRVRSRRLRVAFFADGEAAPCYVDDAERGAPYTTPRKAWHAAAKAACERFEGWFVDAACTHGFTEGTIIDESECSLYGRNRAVVTYAPTDRTVELLAGRELYADEERLEPLARGVKLPQPRELNYGDRLSFDRGSSVWFEQHDRMREAACEQGAYATPAGEGAPARSARITRNTVAYLQWSVPAYDGIALS